MNYIHEHGYAYENKLYIVIKLISNYDISSVYTINDMKIGNLNQR